jgi:hypothetical protein
MDYQGMAPPNLLGTVDREHHGFTHSLGPFATLQISLAHHMTLFVQTVNAELRLGFHGWIPTKISTSNFALKFYVSAFSRIERLAELPLHSSDMFATGVWI